MTTSEVQIVRLPPLRVASAWAYGPQPESLAWQKLEAWARPAGLLDETTGARVFGFNNPNPSPGSPNYGYEFWVTVGSDVGAEGEIRLRDFAGGLYAVMACQVECDLGQEIPAAWQRLDVWVAASAYRPGRHQWLEEHSLQGRIQRLYYPLSE